MKRMTNFRQEKASCENSRESTAMKVWCPQQRLPKRSLANMPSMLQFFAPSYKWLLMYCQKTWNSGPGKLRISLGDKSFDVQGDRSKLIEAVRGINGADKNPGVRLISSMMLKARDLSLLPISLVLTNKSISMSIPTCKPLKNSNTERLKSVLNR